MDCIYFPLILQLLNFCVMLSFVKICRMFLYEIRSGHPLCSKRVISWADFPPPPLILVAQPWLWWDYLTFCIQSPWESGVLLICLQIWPSVVLSWLCMASLMAHNHGVTTLWCKRVRTPCERWSLCQCACLTRGHRKADVSLCHVLCLLAVLKSQLL